MNDLIKTLVFIFFFLITIFGLYKLVTNDKYSASDAFIGVAIFPYSIWIGSQEIAHIVKVPSELRKFENECQSKFKDYGYERSERYRECRKLRIEMTKENIPISEKENIFKYYEGKGIE